MSTQPKPKATPTAKVRRRSDRSEGGASFTIQKDVRSSGMSGSFKIPATRGEVTLGEKTGVVIDKEEWDGLVERLEDIHAFETFERMKEEPPESFISYDEVKRQAWDNKIKEVRRAKGMTQVELAERLGVSQARISELEHFDYRPWASTLEKIAKALECEVTDLITHGGKENIMPRRESKHDKGVRREANRLKRQGWDVEADVSGFETPDPIGQGGHIPDVRATKHGAERIIEVDTPGTEDSDQLGAFRRRAGQKKRTKFDHIIED